jgi:hypothetical protein
MDINSDNGGGSLPPKSDFKIHPTILLIKLILQNGNYVKGDSLTTIPFTAKISETNPYQIQVQSDFVNGKKYQLTFLKETVSSFYAKIHSLNVLILMLIK